MPEKILIIDDDLDTLRLVGLMLQKQGYQIAAANNGEQGILKATKEIPDLILLDVMMPDMDGYEVSKRLRSDPKTKKIPILMFTAKSQLDDKMTGFGAGADDYLSKPTHPTELQAHVKALLSRAKKAEKKQTIPPDRRAFAIGVVSARGGLGISSISLNLGSLLNTEKDKETLLVELKPGTGTIGRDLGLSNLSGLTNLLKHIPENITKEHVREAILEHESGLKLLPASEQPKDMELSNSVPQFETVFSHLGSLADYLIADFGAGLPALSQALLPQCNQIIVVIEGYPNSLTHAKVLIENLIELGIEKEQIIIVLNNRTRSNMLLSLSQVQDNMELPVAVDLPPAPELFSQATDANTAAVLLEPDSITTQQFQKLAAFIRTSQVEKN